ncbi:AAA family ATPase [Marinilactibacillus psychrotolerans]|uniref:AAA family ATPase n=1 Tax=Marinilactibacillus psychrotolerans TaxID=191770 RepID=UPI0039AEB899
MIKNEIVEWVKKQEYWLQVIANSIYKGEKLDSESFDNIFLLFKQEHRLVQEPLVKSELDFLNNEVINESVIKRTLDSISNIKGVNALKNGETLPIGKQVTLIYGENGSGKSGYTRLLNNAFVSRGDKSILANVFKNNYTEPSANFRFTDDKDNIINLSYPENENHSLFNTVSIFDTTSAIHDLTKETELSFIPMEFNFFDEFVQAFLYIKSRLSEEIKNKEVLNEFGDYFDKNTSTKKIVQNINGQTDYEKIKALAKVTELDVTYKEKIKRKAELNALNIDEKLLEYNKFLQVLNNTKEKVVFLNNKFSIERIMKTEELLVEREVLKELSSNEGLELLNGEQIYRLGSYEWKEFIFSAKKYYNSISEEIDSCIFCGQNIEEVTVINKYWKYLKSSAEKNLVAAESNIKKIMKDFDSQDFNLIIKGSKIEDWLKKNQLNLYEKLVSAEKEFMKINSNVIENLSSLKWSKSVEEYKVNVLIFEEVVKLLEEKIKELNVDKVKEELNSIDNFLDEYDDKLKLEKLLPKIKTFIKNSKWADSAKNINLSTQKITTFQNKLFSKHVSSNYIEKFNTECKNLKATFSAEIQQRGRKGVTLSKLSIKGRRPMEILSEGEQRSIALANFLTETGLNDKNECIVFDDPVCSLDYKRREIIAKRLVTEAQKKQVVIMTHDITFLIGIQNHCSSSGVDCSTTTIRKFKDETGIVQVEEVPWIGMPVNKRIKYLRKELQSIEKFYKDINSETIEKLDDYEKKAKLWCQLLRETWERTIEENLFNNSVQRFSPAIQTQRLKKALFTKELYLEIELGMTNCSNWVHDRASGLGEEVPKPEELRDYLDSCGAFVKTNNPNQ